MKLLEFLGYRPKRVQERTDAQVDEALRFAQETSDDALGTANSVKDLVDNMLKRQALRDEARLRLEEKTRRGGA